MKSRKGYLMMVLVALVMLAGCEKDRNLKIKISVNAPSLPTVGIPSEREEWEWKKGDKMILFFNKNVEEDQQVALVYDGKKWEAKIRNVDYVNTLPKKGILDAVYYEGNDIRMRVDEDGHSIVVSECRGKVRLQVENVAYRCSMNTLRAELDMRYPANFVRVTLRGVDAFEGWSLYVEPGDPFHHISRAIVGEINIGSGSSDQIGPERKLKLYEHPEGASSCLEFILPEEWKTTEYAFHFGNEETEETLVYQGEIVPPCEIILEKESKEEASN